MNGDILTIRGLVLETRIGVYDWERVVRQYLVLDLQMVLLSGMVAQAAASDQVQDVLDYGAVTERIQQIASGFSCRLIETFAEVLVTVLFEEFPLQKLTLSVYKTAALAGAESAGLTIERFRQ